jgi:hypothetical protein
MVFYRHLPTNGEVLRMLQIGQLYPCLTLLLRQHIADHIVCAEVRLYQHLLYPNNLRSKGSSCAMSHNQVWPEAFAHAQMSDPPYTIVRSFWHAQIHAIELIIQTFNYGCQQNILTAYEQVVKKQNVFSLVSRNRT